MKYFEAMKQILTNPTQFFEAVAEEQSYVRPWMMFSISYVVIALISFALNAVIYATQNSILYVITASLSLFISVALGFALPFIAAGLSHLGLLMFGARQGFFNTFKPMTYTGLIYIVYMIPATIIGAVVGIVGIYSEVSIFVMPIFAFLNYGIMILAIIHVLIVDTIGVAKFQQISYVRSFFGIVLIPFILLIGLIVVGVILMALVFGSYF